MASIKITFSQSLYFSFRVLLYLFLSQLPIYTSFIFFDSEKACNIKSQLFSGSILDIAKV